MATNNNNNNNNKPKRSDRAQAVVAGAQAAFAAHFRPENLEQVTEGSTPVVIVLDWDDTILPSTWLHKHGVRVSSALDNLPESTKQALRQLDTRASHFLQLASTISVKLCIVTNAEQGWVEATSQKFLPQTAQTLIDCDVNIISARTTFGPLVPNSPVHWKWAAFESILACLTPVYGSNLHVIGCGDSLHDREALFRACMRRKLIAKSLKLMDRPQLREVSTQIAVMARNVQAIVEAKRPVDLKIAPNGVVSFSTDQSTSSSSSESDNENNNKHVVDMSSASESEEESRDFTKMSESESEEELVAAY